MPLVLRRPSVKAKTKTEPKPTADRDFTSAFTCVVDLVHNLLSSTVVESLPESKGDLIPDRPKVS